MSSEIIANTERLEPLLGSSEPIIEPSSQYRNCEYGNCEYRLPKRQSSRPSVIATTCTILVSIPALLGSCCWPILLAGIFGITATASAKTLSHTLSFGINLAVLTNLIQYFAMKRSSIKGTHMKKYGVIYLLTLGTILIMTDLLRHVLMDAGIINMSMYKEDCSPTTIIKGFECLSLVGWVVTVIFTWCGFGCLIVSVVWSSGVVRKTRSAWEHLRY
jgi:hypothetical protein